MAIEFRNVAERYDLEIMVDGKAVRESFLALQDITFSVRKGECVAIVGPNGSGKSTLLRLIAGLLRPEKGEVKVSGRVGSLLDLTAGFHPELTGRDNLFLNAGLYNFSRKDLEARYEQILAFADIGKFINVPVRCYSQGMYVRLAFSLAIHVDPDILLIDDCLAVGDDSFRIKSVDKVLEFKAKKRTIIFVTHDFSLARQLCERGIYLKESRILKDGPVDEALASYLQPYEEEKGRYVFLDAKVKEEEDRRYQEREKERERERERKRLGVTCSFGPALKFVFAASRARIFFNDSEITRDYGLQTLFCLNGADLSSGSAVWRVRVVSERKVVCFLRWPKPWDFLQVWIFDLKQDGVLEWKVLMRSRNNSPISNERIELCLDIPCSLEEVPSMGNKARVLRIGGGSAVDGLLMESLRTDHISGVSVDDEGVNRPYYLKVPDVDAPVSAAERTNEYFHGRFLWGPDTIPPAGSSPVSHTLESNNLRVLFSDGSCRLLAGASELTSAMGWYTSLYCNRIWYDSKQAIWRIEQAASDRLVATGYWPWIPVVQKWEMSLRKDNTIELKIGMKIKDHVSISMQETVLMLKEEYDQWSSGGEKNNFLEEFTCDDLFRMCLWAGKADGRTTLSAYAKCLPAVCFSPYVLKDNRVIVENAAHIAGVRSRVFHCLRSDGADASRITPGEYDFFHGVVNVKEVQT